MMLHKAEISSDKLSSVAEKLWTFLPAGGSELWAFLITVWWYVYIDCSYLKLQMIFKMTPLCLQARLTVS